MSGVGAVGPVLDPNASIEELRKQGISDKDIASLKGIPIEQVTGQVTQLPGVTGPTRSPVLQQIDKNPALANLPEEQKQAIAADPTNPLNPSNPNFVLETKTPFGAEASAEQQLQEAQAKQQAEQIKQFGTEFGTQADEERKKLADTLAGQVGQLQSQYDTGLKDYENALSGSRQKTFEQANPYILEDLNRRGLLTSDTAVAQAQAEKLRQLQAADEANLGQARLGALQDITGFQEQGNQNLGQFEQNIFGQKQDIAGEGMNTLLGGSQDALTSALDLRRTKLQNDLDAAQSAQDRAFAASQATKQRRASLLGAGIGAVGNIAACFDGNSLISMADGSFKFIKDIILGDETLGGEVLSVRKAKTPHGTLFNYRGVIVTGYHAVLDPRMGHWIRVKDSDSSVSLDGDAIVYSLITSKHRIFINSIEFADEIEHEGGQYTPLDESLLILNNEGVTVHG